MCSKIVLFGMLAGVMLLSTPAIQAAVPSPPVNQTLGMPDVPPGNLTAAACAGCHGGGVSDRHHLLYGKPIPPGTQVPYPDTDGNGVRDTAYGCLTCHGPSFTLVANCVVCHTAGAHHATARAVSGDCKGCHGSVVDSMTDGHYIPTYSPSLTTPTPKNGDGLPLNSRGKGAGACDYCHDSGNAAGLPVRGMADLHHDQNFDCLWCHDLHLTAHPMRICERCHGPNSLHNIQADSPAPQNLGTIVVGGELAGYGHVGRDGGPGDSDCWGCHGFAVASASRSGTVIPSVYRADQAVVTAGASATVVLTGAAFTSSVGSTLYEADVKLAPADGAPAITLTPDIVADQGMLAVTIPGTTSPGNYRVTAVNGGLSSNAAAISIVPRVKITQATSTGNTVTVTGAGFGGYAARSRTSLTGTTLQGAAVTGTIVSWNDGKIVANFASLPNTVTVNSVFGKAAAQVAAASNAPARNTAAGSTAPKVRITSATSKGTTVTIVGAGFGSSALRSATLITGTSVRGIAIKGRVVSWQAGRIVATFNVRPSTVTVNAALGQVTAQVIAQ
jgi:hypothetical protein